MSFGSKYFFYRPESRMLQYWRVVSGRLLKHVYRGPTSEYTQKEPLEHFSNGVGTTQTDAVWLEKQSFSSGKRPQSGTAR